MLFLFPIQIHFGSFASDESIFYRDIEFSRDHHAKIAHKKDKNIHHKNVGSTHHKIDEQLLKFLFAKYVEIYKKEYLMSRYLNEVGVSSSASSTPLTKTTTTTQTADRRKCEIRTEYYNDFDVCLKEYYSRSHTNLSSRCDDELKITRTKKTSDNKKQKDRKLLGKQDYKRRSSWNEISKRDTFKPECYKVYTFSDEKEIGGSQIASSYSKAKEDGDDGGATPTNDCTSHGLISFVNDEDDETGIDTTIVTFDRIVEIFPR